MKSETYASSALFYELSKCKEIVTVIALVSPGLKEFPIIVGRSKTNETRCRWCEYTKELSYAA